MSFPAGSHNFSKPSSFNPGIMSSKTGTDATKPCDISNLMSPPELPPIDSFAHSAAAPMEKMQATSGVRKAHGPNPPLSPPISPLTKAEHSVAASTIHGTPVKDPILYPGHDLSPTQQPLFTRDDSVETQRIVDNHVESRPAEFFKQTSPPQREDYELALYFKSRVIELYEKDRKKWFERERAQLLADRKAQSHQNKSRRPQQIRPADKPQPIRSHVQKIVKPSRPAARPLQASAPAQRPIRAASPAAPVQRHAVIRRVSATPDPASRRAAAPSREDKDFNALPDYCPPLTSLPAKANSLKVDWKGAPIDLSSDPHRHLLHPDELSLAAGLRLDAATYLTSKRRMFAARVNCKKISKEFRKTDAQQACKIDVNKASKLWTAFDKVGWLDAHWVAKY